MYCFQKFAILSGIKVFLTMNVGERNNSKNLNLPVIIPFDQLLASASRDPLELFPLFNFFLDSSRCSGYSPKLISIQTRSLFLAAILHWEKFSIFVSSSPTRYWQKLVSNTRKDKKGTKKLKMRIKNNKHSFSQIPK